MSYRPGIIKSAGLTNVVPLAGVEPAIPQGAYKSRAATNAFLRGEGSANFIIAYSICGPLRWP